MNRDEVEIRAFVGKDAEPFRKLNEDWITTHFALEEEDRRVLNDPEGQIILKGGHIFMAFVDQTAAGCCALIAVKPGVFELAKMTVATSLRGKGVGRKILAHTIEQARILGATSLFLETNSKLHDAIHLYEALGFRHLPPDTLHPSPYRRADVFMDLRLREDGL